MSTTGVPDTLIDRDRLYIGGSWTTPAGPDRIEVVNSDTEQVMGRIPAGTAADVDAAVAAARAAFDEWSQVSPTDRAEVCAAVAAGLPIMTFASQPQVVQEMEWEEQIGNSLVVREPVGVLGAITPWNYPLHQIAAKVAPAMTAGCTVVLKPSVVTPLNAFVLAEVMDEVGVPAGVFNLVTGIGPVVGEAIAAHPGIDMVSFTGSTRAGRRVSEVASATVKRVALELGGKSPNVLLDDLDEELLQRAVIDGVGKCFINSGQTCSALTRMLVPREALPAVEAIVAAMAEGFPLGHPLDPDAVAGPLVSAVQQKRVTDYIRQGIDEGAKLVAGGTEPPAGFEQGYYVRPTVFSDVTPDMTIAQEEIFGPVLCIIPYDGEDDAVAKANDSVYGLAGGVWSASPERAEAVARRLRTGQVEINGGVFNPLAPFGGYKQSGHGRELGRHGLEEFLVLKSMQR